jgi:hypothetical protein
MIAGSLSAGRHRHDHRMVMMVVAMGQRRLHNVLIIGACDKRCQSLLVKISLPDNQERKRIQVRKHPYGILCLHQLKRLSAP